MGKRQQQHTLKVQTRLEAFFDDSGSDAQSPVFVLAGFVLPTERWKSFSIAWRNVLNQDPRLNFFKMAEARSFQGEFKHGWNRELRDQRVFELAHLIRNYEPVRIDCAVRRDHFNIFRQNLPGRAWQDPYFICFYYIITLCVEGLLDRDDEAVCDFIFDEQSAIGEHAAGWWPVAKLLAGRLIGERMGSEPVFRDDKQYPPLQAADLYAWQMRHFLKNELEFPQQATNEIARLLAPLKHFTKFVSLEDLSDLRSAALAPVTKYRLDGRC
jgi:Protein of unknown function (DUF3800)